VHKSLKVIEFLVKANARCPLSAERTTSIVVFCPLHLLLAGGFPRVLFPPLWCFPPAVSGWGLCVGRVDPVDDLASTGFHDCHQRTVRQPRPTRPRLATGARPSVPHHHTTRPRRARTTSRPTSLAFICSCCLSLRRDSGQTLG